MSNLYIENVKIVDTSLGYECHSCFTCYLHLEGNGCSISYGGYILDEWNEEKGKRLGTAKGFQAITEIINTLEVNSWEKLKGQFIRMETGGPGTCCTRIGHLIKDKWFSFEEHFAQERSEKLIRKTKWS